MPAEEVTTILSEEDDDMTSSPLPSDNEDILAEIIERGQFVMLQKWEGYVLYADEETFTARLIDSLRERKPHQAAFSRLELSPQEQELVEPGALFSWTMGFRQVGSRRRRESQFYFRRLQNWTAEEIQASRQRAEELNARIGWD